MSLREQRQQELEALLDTFASEGYNIFLRDVAIMYEVLRDGAVDSCDTGNKWLERRSALKTLASVIAYSEAAKSEYEHLDEAVFEDEPEHDDRNPLED